MQCVGAIVQIIAKPMAGIYTSIVTDRLRSSGSLPGIGVSPAEYQRYPHAYPALSAFRPTLTALATLLVGCGGDSSPSSGSGDGVSITSSGALPVATVVDRGLDLPPSPRPRGAARNGYASTATAVPTATPPPPPPAVSRAPSRGADGDAPATGAGTVAGARTARRAAQAAPDHVQAGDAAAGGMAIVYLNAEATRDAELRWQAVRDGEGRRALVGHRGHWGAGVGRRCAGQHRATRRLRLARNGQRPAADYRQELATENITCRRARRRCWRRTKSTRSWPNAPVSTAITPAASWSGAFVRPNAAELSDQYGILRGYNGAPPTSYHTGTDFAAFKATRCSPRPPGASCLPAR